MPQAQIPTQAVSNLYNYAILGKTLRPRPETYLLSILLYCLLSYSLLIILRPTLLLIQPTFCILLI